MASEASEASEVSEANEANEEDAAGAEVSLAVELLAWISACWVAEGSAVAEEEAEGLAEVCVSEGAGEWVAGGAAVAAEGVEAFAENAEY